MKPFNQVTIKGFSQNKGDSMIVKDRRLIT